MQCGKKPVETWNTGPIVVAIRSGDGHKDQKGRVAHGLVGAVLRGLALLHGPRGNACRRRHAGGRDRGRRRAQSATRSSSRATGGSRPKPSAPISGSARATASTPQDRPGAQGALRAPACFQDVRINQSGGRLIVTVVENPVINRVAFEGNKKVKDDQLKNEVQSKPRGTLSRPTVQADVQRIVEIYRRNGRFDVRVEPKIIELPNNRVDLVFEIKEGEKTGVKKIIFVGNNASGDQRLKDEIKTSETNWLQLPADDRHLRSRPRRSRSRPAPPLLSQARLRRRARRLGGRRYDPDKKGFIVTFTIDEGAQYASARSTYLERARVDPASLRGRLKLGAGDVYNADLVEKSVENMTIEVARRGYPFAVVRPRGDRDFATKTINVVFMVEEGPRVYIERINIRGNTRTRDYVIRREFDIGEGDAYNRALIDRAERRLKNLNYFKTVKITNEPGSAPDRIVLNVDVEEKPTGEFSIAGGYSTADGFMAELSVAERNLLGHGQYAKASRAIRPARARLRAVVRRALSPGLPHGRRHRPLRAAEPGDELRFVRQPNRRQQSAPRLCADRGAVVPGALHDLSAEDHAAGCSTTTVSIANARSTAAPA